ncbi:hypothetical protein R8Z50_02110 [Longispora sp. K20-0274]|uniref:hypothetical protein n=1 Tax=Longispora sp. K20-0274 TaxID=3088255 RepID=UPI00399B69DD
MGHSIAEGVGSGNPSATAGLPAGKRKFPTISTEINTTVPNRLVTANLSRGAPTQPYTFIAAQHAAWAME